MVGIACERLPFNILALKEAECRLYGLPQTSFSGVSSTPSVADAIANTRKRIENSLKSSPVVPGSGDRIKLEKRVEKLEEENASMHKDIKRLTSLVASLEAKMSKMELSQGGDSQVSTDKTTAPKSDADSDVDLFGSSDEEESAEKERIKQERLKAYQDKKTKKPGAIAKSNVIFDVKPWDDETDMSEMEKLIKSIEMDGLVWGATKLVPVAFGIKKLQIMCVVVDDKVSIDELTEKIELFEDYVQSVDIAAFNKI